MIIYDTNGDRIHAKRVVIIRTDGWGYAFKDNLWLQIVYRSGGYWVVTELVVSYKEVLKELAQCDM